MAAAEGLCPHHLNPVPLPLHTLHPTPPPQPDPYTLNPIPCTLRPVPPPSSGPILTPHALCPAPYTPTPKCPPPPTPLQLGADAVGPSCRFSPSQNSCLHLAAMAGHREVVALLLKVGAGGAAQDRGRGGGGIAIPPLSLQPATCVAQPAASYMCGSACSLLHLWLCMWGVSVRPTGRAAWCVCVCLCHAARYCSCRH